MEPILKLDHIQKYYGNEGNITKAIQDISFSVEAGEFLGIMGASGTEEIGRGTGRTKKAAEAMAAYKGILKLKEM